jgi:hypothetical protein
MTIVVNVARNQEQATRYIADSGSHDTLIIIRAPRLATITDQSRLVDSIVQFPFAPDDDELITWEDAECL